MKNRTCCIILMVISISDRRCKLPKSSRLGFEMYSLQIFTLYSLSLGPLRALNGLSLYYYHRRVSQAVAALLRRFGLQYQGNESYGKIRINGLVLRRWFQPKLAPPFMGKPGDWSSSQSRLGKGITHQQRDIRTGNLSSE